MQRDEPGLFLIDGLQPLLLFTIPLKYNRDIMTQYGFIGTGSMGSMLIRKFTGSGLVAPGGISASSKSGISARALAGTTGITAEPSTEPLREMPMCFLSA